jgi:hypothetical protein
MSEISPVSLVLVAQIQTNAEPKGREKLPKREKKWPRFSYSLINKLSERGQRK